MNKEKKEKHRNSVTEILASQLKTVLEKIGISNLHIKEDGTLCGETRKMTYYPTTHYLSNIRLEEIDGQLKINAEVTGSGENTGSVI